MLIVDYFFSECLFWFIFCLKYKQIINKSCFFFCLFIFLGNTISDFSSWKQVREICASSILEHEQFSLVGNQNVLNCKQNKSLLRWRTFIENVLHFSSSSKESLFCYTSGYLHNLNQCYLHSKHVRLLNFCAEKDKGTKQDVTVLFTRQKIFRCCKLYFVFYVLFFC